jgi:RHS repeat-associated protein
VLKKHVRPFFLSFFALFFALQPIIAPVSAAASQRKPEAETFAALSQRSGVELAFFTDPAAYLAQQEAMAHSRQTAALAELAARYAPPADLLARVEAEAEAVKVAHAIAAVQGIPGLLAQLEQRATVGWQTTSGRSADFTAYHRLITAALADVQRATGATSNPQAADFFAQTAASLHTLEAALANPPADDAPAESWRAYLQTVRLTLTSQQTTAQSAPFTPAVASLPISPLAARPRTPYTSRPAYWRREGGPADLLAAPLTRLFNMPGGGDLAETPDVHFTADIQSLISNLQSPVSIFNYVHDNIYPELYYGSKKGSTGTLYEMAGNNFDQASLLIALYRAAGIPARYATGRVWLSDEQARDVTNTTDTRAAADALQSAGIPTVYVNRPGLDPVVEIEHTWVQVWLPYDTYRGVLAGPAASSWINLDPFIKRYSFSTPVDLRNAVAFNPDTYLNTLTETLPVDVWENELRAYVQANDLECATWAAASRLRTILPDNLELLPAELPVIHLNTLAIPSELPAGQRYTVTLSLQDGQGNVELSHNATLPEIYGRRIDLTYPAATSADQSLIDSYGGLLNTPPYLIHLRPTLAISETVVASGSPLTAGSDRLLVVTFTTPGLLAANQISHRTQAGGVYVVGLDYQSVPQRLLDEATGRTAVLSGDSLAAQQLHLALLAYFRSFNRGREDVTGILQSGTIRDVGAGFATRPVQASYLFGAASSLADGGYFLDVPKLSFAFYDLEGGQERADEVTRLIGYNSSVLEHLVWQSAFGYHTISAVKALQLAADSGQTIHTITSAGQVPGLGVAPDVKNALLNALNRGWFAKVSQNPIAFYQWNGTGYIVYDPATGAAGYMISGGLNGAQTTKESFDKLIACGRDGLPFACGSIGAKDVIQAYEEWVSQYGPGGSGGSFSGSGSGAGGGAGGTGGSGGPAGGGGGSGSGGGSGVLCLPWCPGDEPKGERRDNAAGGSVVGDPVNLSNGNMFMRFMDIALPGRGLPIAFDRTYNSLEPEDGRLGWGWSDGFGQQIIANGDGSRTFVNNDGATYDFTPDGLGGYEAPPALRYTLVETGSGYELTHLSGLMMSFDSSGRLTTMADPNGNTLSFNYSGSQLSTVEDAAGQTALTFTYNGAGRIGSVSDGDGRTVQYSYDAAGNLTGVTDVTNTTTTYAYDDHRLIRITDALGNSHFYAYDVEGRLYRHVNPAGEVESFSYDFYNKRAVVTDATGQDTLYILDDLGRVISRTDPLGNQAVNIWDDDHNLIGQIDARGNEISTTYDANGNPVSYSNALGYTTNLAYNGRGQVISQTQMVGGVPYQSSYSYDGDGNLIGQTDAAGNSFTYDYDGNGQLLQTSNVASGATVDLSYNLDGTVAEVNQLVHDADGGASTVTQAFDYGAGGFVTDLTSDNGRTSTITYDEAGRIESVAAADGVTELHFNFDNANRLAQASYIRPGHTYVVSFTLDALGRAVSQNDSDGNAFQRTYNGSGQLAAQTDARGQVTRFEYDELGRLVRTLGPDGSINALGYCADGNGACAAVDANGYTATVSEDALGRVTAQTDPLGHVTSFLYDELNRIVELTDAENNTTEYVYNSDGLYQVIDALNQVTSFGYDSQGNLASLTDANNHTRTYLYDELGRLIRETDAGGHTSRYYYDDMNRLRRIIDANGATIDYNYNADGRLISIVSPDGSTSFGPDSSGRIVAQSNSDTSQSFVYDGRGRLASTSQQIGGNGKTIQYGYGPDMSLTAVTNAEGQVTRYSYDALGRLVAISAPGGRTTFAYDLAGRRIQMSLPNGITTYYSYDGANRLLAQVSRSADNQVVAAFSYSYNGVNLRTSVTDLAGRTTTYTYDELYRLTDVVYGDGRSQQFSYDPVGNRLSQTVNGVTTTYTYDIDDRLTSETTGGQTSTYTYDNNGNQLTRSDIMGLTSYSYDSNNQMTAITLPDGSDWEFGYSPDGFRVYALYSPVTGAPQRTDFLLLGNSVLTDYQSNGRITHYLRGPWTDELLGQETGGEWTYNVQDDLGTLTVLTDATGAVLGRRSYDVFGQVLSQSGEWESRYGYTGREEIGDTGLMYYRARSYDTEAGRFTSVDPVFGSPQSPQSLQRYNYVLNNPVNLRDPSGMTPQPPPTEFHTLFVQSLVTQGVPLLAQIAKIFMCKAGLANLCAFIIAAEYTLVIAVALTDISNNYPEMPNNIMSCACLFLFIGAAIGAAAEFYLANAEGLPVAEQVAKVASQKVLATVTELFRQLLFGIAADNFGSRAVMGVITRLSELVKELIFTFDSSLSKPFVIPWLIKFFIAPEVAIGFCSAFYWVFAQKK